MSGRVDLRREGRCASIMLDRPHAKNAMTPAMVDGLRAAVLSLQDDDAVDVVVLTGAGSDFCAGADVDDITALLARGPADRAAAFEDGMRSTIQPLMAAVLDLPQLLVVAARGHAVGLGAALLLAADLTVLSRTARISVPQVRLGHSPDHGESWLLPRKVGLGRALPIALLGAPLTADDAERFGLATALVDDDRLEATTGGIVESVLALPSMSIRGTKRLLWQSLEHDRTAQFAMEVRTAASCAATPDFVTAIEGRFAGRRTRTGR